jgi:hypothetical protein
MSVAHPLDLTQVSVELVAGRRVNQIAQRNLQNFFYAVAQQTSWTGVDRQESALKVMDTEQVSAMFNEIAIPVRVFFQRAPGSRAKGSASEQGSPA